MIRRLLLALAVVVGLALALPSPAGAFPASVSVGKVTCTSYPQNPAAEGTIFGVLVVAQVVVWCNETVPITYTDYLYAESPDAGYVVVNAQQSQATVPAGGYVILNVYGSCNGYLETYNDGDGLGVYQIPVVTVASLSMANQFTSSASDWVGADCFSLSGPVGTAYAL